MDDPQPGGGWTSPAGRQHQHSRAPCPVGGAASTGTALTGGREPQPGGAGSRQWPIQPPHQPSTFVGQVPGYLILRRGLRLRTRLAICLVVSWAASIATTSPACQRHQHTLHGTLPHLRLNGLRFGRYCEMYLRSRRMNDLLQVRVVMPRGR